VAAAYSAYIAAAARGLHLADAATNPAEATLRSTPGQSAADPHHRCGRNGRHMPARLVAHLHGRDVRCLLAAAARGLRLTTAAPPPSGSDAASDVGRRARVPAPVEGRGRGGNRSAGDADTVSRKRHARGGIRSADTHPLGYQLWGAGHRLARAPTRHLGRPRRHAMLAIAGAAQHGAVERE
jgi:hypothetical protein